MNKSELSELYRLLGKLKYIIASDIIKIENKDTKKHFEKAIDAINLILSLNIIDGSDK